MTAHLLEPPARDTAGTDTAARRRCAGTVVVFFLLSAVLLVLVATGWEPLLSFDSRLADRLHAHAVEHPGWVEANRVLTDWVWDPLTMRVLTVATAVWLWWRRMVRGAAFLFLSTGAGLVVQQSTKALVERERPQWPDPVDSAHYAAFPSGHVMGAAVACGALLWLFLHRSPAAAPWRAAAVALSLLSVLGVAFTRLYLGVHWPTDLAGGVLLGGGVLMLCAAVCRPWRS